MNAVEVFKEIKASAEAIKSDEQQQFPEAASAGDYWRQGDIYVTRLDDVPDVFDNAPVELQLAPGTTKGSRHLLSHSRVQMFVRPNADALTGPVFRNEEPVTVIHPEHGDIVCPPGVYSVTYQRAFAETLRAVRD